MRETPSLRDRIFRLGNRLLAQSADAGARPTVTAATDAAARNGDYYGPSGLFQMRGADAVKVSPAKRALDDTLAEALWQRSCELTGVDYAALADAPATPA